MSSFCEYNPLTFQAELDAEYEEEADAWIRGGMKAKRKQPPTQMTREGSTIRTFTGKLFHPFAPNPKSVDVRDIAHALSHICRYAGHSLIFYSVAQHAMLATDIAFELSKKAGDSELEMFIKAFEVLHHDDPEAYTLDMPKPIKQHLPDFNELESIVTRAVNTAIGLIGIHHDFVKVCDFAAYESEAKVLFDRNALNTKLQEDWPFSRILKLTPPQAEQMFLDYADYIASSLASLAPELKAL